jgi:hypothetical protein
VPGKLDDISLAIGEMRADVRGLRRDADDNRRLADERHAENVERLDAIRDTTSVLASDAATLKGRVDIMEPKVDASETFIRDWGKIIALAGTVVASGIAGLWQLVIHWGEVKALIGRLFH